MNQGTRGSSRRARWLLATVAGAVAACAALSLSAPAAPADYGPDLETYRALIESYLSGEDEGPPQVTASWGPIWIDSTVGRLLEALTKAPESRRGSAAYDVRAAQDHVRLAQGAFLLHTHTALAGHGLGLSPPDHDEHVEAARRFLRWLQVRYKRERGSWPVEARGLRPRDFSLALASGELLMARPEVALEIAEESLSSEGYDAEMHLVAGCAREAEAVVRRQTDGRWHDRTLRAAEHRFRKALDHDPALVEARLRLGWVLVRRGSAPEARPLLEAVAEAPGDDRRRALAWLFLGVVHEMGEDPSARIAAYRRAVEIAPYLQAAHIGLAHALEESAGEEAATRVLGPFFLERSRTWARHDPWNEYPFGPPELGVRPFALLRERLCRR